MRYHINPETGKAGQCSAKKGNCRFRNKNDADQEIPHYPTREAALKAYEEIAEKKYGSTASVKKKSRQSVRKGNSSTGILLVFSVACLVVALLCDSPGLVYGRVLSLLAFAVCIMAVIWSRRRRR